MMSKNILITNCPSAYFKWTAMIKFYELNIANDKKNYIAVVFVGNC
jgi:hypothetical protein